jgi:hypothetical protein
MKLASYSLMWPVLSRKEVICILKVKPALKTGKDK